MKITMNISDDLLDRVDRYAKSNYLNRTSVFSIAVSQYLMAQEIPTMMVNLNNALIKISETGTITDEQRRTLDAVQLLVDSLAPNSPKALP